MTISLYSASVPVFKQMLNSLSGVLTRAETHAGSKNIEPGALLRVGPYQGTLGCLDITFGRGVCGSAATEQRTIIVPDVQLYPGHISCDARSRSEIVVPVFDAHGLLLAVLDIDSSVPDAFGEADREGLEALVAWFARTSYVPVLS